MAEERANYSYGLDAELQAKENAKRDYELETKIQGFLEELSGRSFEGNGFLESLRDGVILCLAMNKVRPGAIPKINMKTDGKPFLARENISNFLKACRDLGMKENDLFTTPDLYDLKSPVNVAAGVVNFSRAATKSGFTGPCIAPKESIGAKVKRWSLNARNSAVSLLNMGSKGIMEKPHISKPGITFGADNSGASQAPNEVGKLGMGSKGIMEKPHISKPGITFGADNSGASQAPNEVGKLGLGSKGIMEKAHISKAGPTFGAEAGR